MVKAEGVPENYERPLMTVPSWEFDEYVSALETTLRERLEEVPEPSLSSYSEIGYGLDSHQHRADPWAVDRSIYRELLEGLEDVEDKNDLFMYAGEVVETPEPRLPAPFSFLEKITGSMVEAERGNLVEEVFEEAKRELAEPENFSRSNP